MKGGEGDNAGHPPLSDRIAKWLTNEIQSGKLDHGARLPTERELCNRFSVSRTVVREALSRLKSNGLITSFQGSGAFVSERGQLQSFRVQDFDLDEERALAHVVELLVTVEVGYTRLAAKRRTVEDLKRMHRALVGIEYAIAHDQLGDAEDFAFHQAILDATQNPYFRGLGDHLEHSVRRLIRQARSSTARNHKNLIHAVQQEHYAIYRAIEAREPDAAALAAESHLRNAAKRLKLYLAL